MRCYICNKETNNFRKDYDGRYVSICSECRRIIRDQLAIYEDADEDLQNTEWPVLETDEDTKDGSVCTTC